MTFPSGVSAQLMTAEEVTYGTAVTPDRGFEFLSESLTLDVARIESSALRSGALVQRSDRWAPGRRSVSGDISMELGTKGFGRWWKHLLGGVVTSQPDAGDAPTVYLHTFTPGPQPAGLTVQVGRPNNTGTVTPWTYSGCKVTQWTLENSVNDLVKLTVSLLGRDCTTATALAAVSYPAGLDVMSFIQGTFSVGGSEMKIRNFSLQGGSALADERFNLGSALRDEPKDTGMRPYTGRVEPEFKDLDAYARYAAGEEAELELLFQGDVIEDDLHYETRVTANVRWDGPANPTVDGPAMLMNPLPFKVVDNGTLSLEIEYQTTDTLP